jgi:hypothetical protein
MEEKPMSDNTEEKPMSDNTEEKHGCYTDYGVSGYGVAIKLSRNNPMEDAFVRKIAEEMMLSIASKCMDSGARTIGHIKSHISTEAGTIKADTIGVSHGASSKGNLKHPVNDLYMAINSIVAGITEEAVKDATLDGMHLVAEKDGLTVVKEKEHAYFDEFDFMQSEENSSVS